MNLSLFQVHKAKSLKLIVLFFALALFIFGATFALLLLHQRPLNATTYSNSSKPIVKQPSISKNFPIRIKIPKIHVDAAIENVGITQSGAMDVPRDINNVGWYTFGSVPGTIGSAVMDGHVDGRNGEVGIFALLHVLSFGDKIFILDNRGKSTSFIVSKTHLFNSKEDTSVIFNQSDRSHLNLITCSGTWDNFQQIYTKRMVVFSDIAR